MKGYAVMKKLLSFLLCAVMAFSVISGTVFTAGMFDVSITSEAADYNKTMLPYCYRKLTDEEKLAYLKIRTAFIDHKKSVDIEIPVETADKLINILMFADSMTSFNVPVGDSSIEYYYYENTMTTSSMMFSYVYSKKNYDLLIQKADKAADKIISKFTDKTTDYEKIKIIHDYIIDKTEYFNNNANSSIYDALVKGNAKCDGYAHAFDYVCAKAGIRSCEAYGTARNENGSSEAHVWNKVYYNKKWYNVDVTWDDPVDNLKENKSYKYFMISDRAISATHTQEDKGFYVPAAKSEDADYYKKYGFYARTLNEAKTIFADKAAEAAKKGRSSVTVRFSDEELYNSAVKCFEETNDMFSILERASKKAGGTIIDDGCLYEADNSCSYTYTIYFYFKGSRISDYYSDVKQLDSGTFDFLKELGLKTE